VQVGVHSASTMVAVICMQKENRFKCKKRKKNNNDNKIYKKVFLKSSFFIGFQEHKCS
jgi:hypothetical protein